MALSHVAHATIRNRGTTVGSIVHADAAAELPVVLKLLGGSLEVESSAGRRTIPADDLYLGPLESSLHHDEIAVSAFFPILFFFIAFIIGLGSGAAVLIGQAWGAKKPEAVKTVAGATLSVGFIVGLAVAIVVGMIRDPSPSTFNNVAYAGLHLVVLCCGAWPALVGRPAQRPALHAVDAGTVAA